MWISKTVLPLKGFRFVPICPATPDWGTPDKTDSVSVCMCVFVCKFIYKEVETTNKSTTVFNKYYSLPGVGQGGFTFLSFLVSLTLALKFSLSNLSLVNFTNKILSFCFFCFCYFFFFAGKQDNSNTNTAPLDQITDGSTLPSENYRSKSYLI